MPGSHFPPLNSSDKKEPYFQNSCCRKFVKCSYLLGSISTLVCAALFATYLFAYPFRSNVCNGLVGSGTLSGDSAVTGIEERCKNQTVNRGYKSTTQLVHAGLLPIDWTKKDGNDEYQLCSWNANTKVCEEAEPSAPECFSEKDTKGRRKNRWGNDGKCEALKAPEICRQTGFKDSNNEAKQEDLAIQGAIAEASAIVLLVTTCLAVLQTLNYHWLVLSCDNKNCAACCESYGRPCGCNIGSLFCPNFAKVPCLDALAKGNLNEEQDEAGFNDKFEAATIFLSFAVHNILILIFGLYGKGARDTVENECFGVENEEGCKSTPNIAAGEKLCVYGTNQTAREYIESNKGSGNTGDAERHLKTRNDVFEVAWVFWWINASCFLIQLVTYVLSRRNSADMDLVAIRDINELTCADISADEDNKIKSRTPKNDKVGYMPVSQVQLRSAF